MIYAHKIELKDLVKEQEKLLFRTGKIPLVMKKDFFAVLFYVFNEYGKTKKREVSFRIL